MASSVRISYEINVHQMCKKSEEVDGINVQRPLKHHETTEMSTLFMNMICHSVRICMDLQVFLHFV